MGQPRPLFVYFRSFQANFNTIFATYQCEKMSIHPAFITPTLNVVDLTFWAVVVAQLVEQSLPIPKVRGSNPVIGKKLYLY